MAGYYDQLQAQLEQATERGVPRRRLAVAASSRPRLHLRADWIVAGLALACALAVAFVFVRAGGGGAHRQHAIPGPSSRLALVRNYAPATPPALGGQLICDSALTAPRGAASPAGTAIVRTRPPTRFVYRLTAHGLAPSPRGQVYEVWLLPETSTSGVGYVLLNGEPPIFAGVISPGVGAGGRLDAEALIPQTATGDAYRIEITAQRPSAKAPGRTVLSGNLVF